MGQNIAAILSPESQNRNRREIVSLGSPRPCIIQDANITPLIPRELFGVLITQPLPNLNPWEFRGGVKITLVRHVLARARG